MNAHLFVRAVGERLKRSIRLLNPGASMKRIAAIFWLTVLTVTVVRAKHQMMEGINTLHGKIRSQQRFKTSGIFILSASELP